MDSTTKRMKKEGARREERKKWGDLVEREGVASDQLLCAEEKNPPRHKGGGVQSPKGERILPRRCGPDLFLNTPRGEVLLVTEKPIRFRGKGR